MTRNIVGSDIGGVYRWTALAPNDRSLCQHELSEREQEGWSAIAPAQRTTRHNATVTEARRSPSY